MRRLSITEIHEIILGIAKEFDKVCTNNDIPYFMLGGTMLGAIRHKGFIPWDDDMDFGVPAEKYESLLKALKDELPQKYGVCTFKTHEGCGTAYAKIEDRRTLVNDPRMWRVPNDKQIGLNIDIFPLSICDKNSPKLAKILSIKKRYARIYTGNANRVRWKNTLKSLLQALDIHNREWYLSILYELATTSENRSSGKSFRGNLLGRWGEREIVPELWYGMNVRYEFEDTRFCGIEKYDDYLHSLYGDYMKLPPVDERTVHVETAYIK